MINISWISCFFKFFIFPLFLENVPQALYVNPGCLQCSSRKNLSSSNTHLFVISFILYSYNKRGPTKGIWRRWISPKLLINPLASCSFLNFDFLQSHTAHFDKDIIFPFFVFTTLNFHFLYFFCTSNNAITLSYK